MAELVRRLVMVENDQLPYDYEQGLCAWCRVGTDAAHPERYMPVHPERFVATPHAEDCPYAEALGLILVTDLLPAPPVPD